MTYGIHVRADRLRSKRSERGFTQRQLAARVGVTQNYIAAIEGGASSAGPELRPKLMAALDAPFSEIFRVVVVDAFGRELPLRP